MVSHCGATADRIRVFCWLTNLFSTLYYYCLAHPIHLHLVKFEILYDYTFTYTIDEEEDQITEGHMGVLGTAPKITSISEFDFIYRDDEYYIRGARDTVVVLPGDPDALTGRGSVIRVTFPKAGRYNWHCHILSHEDHEMMRPMHIVDRMDHDGGNSNDDSKDDFMETSSRSTGSDDCEENRGDQSKSSNDSGKDDGGSKRDSKVSDNSRSKRSDDSKEDGSGSNRSSNVSDHSKREKGDSKSNTKSSDSSKMRDGGHSQSMFSDDSTKENSGSKKQSRSSDDTKDGDGRNIQSKVSSNSKEPLQKVRRHRQVT